ncbi:AAA family ATPase [Bacillus idriensis]|uniref:AAA family ATPase n=1 Tax=Metabacillus idriensis TaxID=324768 RepID=A0A6I2M941_9BACI|nr:AAA family ATPase [Metabacillus idriensis]MRX54648.1 AAA family ATPase [Metabacillus idriensis]
MNHASLLFSRILDANDIGVLTRFDIKEADLITAGERRVYKFIQSYAEQNRGNAPSAELVADQCPDFVYAPTTDSYEYLAKQIKSMSAKMKLKAALENPDFAEKFGKEDGNILLDDLISELEQIRIGTSVRKNIGKSLDDLKYDFYSEYLKRKEGKSHKLWKTPFERLNNAIGGFYSGDIYGVMAESGRGKSYLIIAFIDCLLRQGANVLIKSYELKSYLWLSRLFSVLTAVDRVLKDEQGRAVGLPNRDILSGNLEGDIEAKFLEMVDAINKYYPGNLYLQAKGDPDLTRSLADLDRELQLQPEIDVVVVDPFYGLDDVYGRNANKTAGGAAEQAARYFERIVGQNDVVGIYAVQASTEKSSQDEDGIRELKLPTRDQVKTTKALLEIATNLFSFDSSDGQAMIGIEKGRNGFENLTVELIALLDYGVLREPETGEAAASQFEF